MQPHVLCLFLRQCQANCVHINKLTEKSLCTITESVPSECHLVNQADQEESSCAAAIASGVLYVRMSQGNQELLIRSSLPLREHKTVSV